MEHKIPSHLSDHDLITAIKRLAITERCATVALITHLAEFDGRRLCRGAGFSSTFKYCTQVLRLSEGGAYNRIETARAARKFPRVLDLLEQGALTVTTARILAPHLNAENQEGLLTAASYKSRRAVEELVARAFPKPDVASSVRKLPVPGTLAAAFAPPLASVPAGDPSLARLPDVDPGGALSPVVPAVDASQVLPTRAVVEGAPLVPAARPASRHPLISPLSEDRYQIRFTASAGTCEKLKLAQDLLRHAVPSGDPAEIFDCALTALIEDLGRKKFAATKRPRRSRGQRADSRNIPAHVKRAVVARDGGRCAFVARDHGRCGERAFLEFHHVVPYAMGGPATGDNIQLRCRAHNGYEAEVCFGRSAQGGSELVPGRVRQSGTSSPTRASQVR